jgi:hypothetical protein
MARPGRPTLYKPDNAELARKFCLLGATNDDLAGCFEVARRTIDDWIATIPDFADGVKQGRDIADAAVVQKLYARATGCSLEVEKVFLFRGEPKTATYTVHYSPDTQACMFWLRNRRRQHWLEKAQALLDDGADWPSELDAAAERAAMPTARERARSAAESVPVRRRPALDVEPFQRKSVPRRGVASRHPVVARLSRPGSPLNSGQPKTWPGRGAWISLSRPKNASSPTTCAPSCTAICRPTSATR